MLAVFLLFFYSLGTIFLFVNDKLNDLGFVLSETDFEHLVLAIFVAQEHVENEPVLQRLEIQRDSEHFQVLVLLLLQEQLGSRNGPLLLPLHRAGLELLLLQPVEARLVVNHPLLAHRLVI